MGLQTKGTSVKVQEWKRLLLLMNKTELSFLAWLDLSPSEEREVYERRLDTQAEGKLHRVLQVKGRIINNVLGRWGF